jgi:hypothetical protein
MSWITITLSDLLTKWASPEVEAAQTAATATDQPDPVPDVITQVVREVRGYVAACGKNTLGAGETIPDELLGAALSRIRFECATRLPGGPLMDEDRRTANANALSMLRDAAACRIAIVQPDNVSPEVIATSSAVQVVTKTRLKTSRHSLMSL